MEKINTFELMSFIYALTEALDNYSRHNNMTEKRSSDSLINEEYERFSYDAIGLMIELFDSLKFTDIEKIERAYKRALDLYFKEAAEV